MTPILFADGTTDYSTQGMGALSDAMTCEVNEELNGEYELQMTYPVSGRRYADIKNRCIIYCKPDPYRGAQPFRIYRITRPMNGAITVYAQHISYDLSGIPVNPFTTTGAQAALSGLQSHAAVSCPFTFWTNISSSTEFSVTVPSSIRSMLGGTEGSILDTFGGEYEWDNTTVRLYARRGQDNGVRIAYGKNLTDIQQDENIANIATGVIGYWAGSDGTLVQSPVVNAPGTYNFVRVITVDFSGDFEEQPTAEQLQQRTQQYVTDNQVGVPDVSITVSWMQLEQYSGYEGLSLLERVTLGDTVTVEFPPLGVEATARVVKTTYDAMHDRYTSADIGSVQANIADTIANQQQQISNQPDKTEIQQIAQSITNAVLGARGGSVRILDTDGDGDPDTLYIADNADPALAQKVWRFNYQGWGASSNGYNGPFEMSASLGMGMYADFITVGVLTAIRIQSADGRSSWDLSNGNSVFNSNSITINSDNFQLSANGEVNANGAFHSNNGIVGAGRNESILTSGGLDLYRTLNTSQNVLAFHLEGWGSAAAMSRMQMYGASGTEMVTLYTDFDGSHMSLRNGYSHGAITLAGSTGNAEFEGNVDIQGPVGLGVSYAINCQTLNASQGKNRVVLTSRGYVGIGAFETPQPQFGDAGSGKCNANGECYIMLSALYGETISSECIPRWIVSPTSPGSLWVEKHGQDCTVHGEPGQTFDWMCMAPQKGYDDVYGALIEGSPPKGKVKAYEDLDDLAESQDPYEIIPEEAEV